MLHVVACCCAKFETGQTFSPVQKAGTLLDVTCCDRLHTLLHVVACCCAKFETGQTFSPVQKAGTLLDVTCCDRLHTLLHVVACCCAKFETGQTFSPVQTDATLLASNSQNCWELLRPFARNFIKVIQELYHSPYHFLSILYSVPITAVTWSPRMP